MNQDINPQFVKQLLNHSVANLDAATVSQLRASRTAALAHRRVARIAPVLAGWNEAWQDSFYAHKQRFFVTSILLAACLFSGAAYWQHTHDHDHSEVDIAILTDELPVDVYVD